MSIATKNMMDLWVNQELGRFKKNLIERGFIREIDAENESKLRDAHLRWRRTYIADLSFDEPWIEERISITQDVLDWRLGGWAGWLAYRPSGKAFTTFGDVARELAYGTNSEVPAHHRELVARSKRMENDLFEKSVVIVLENGRDRAVLEGTHRVTSLAVAIFSGANTPQEMRILRTSVTARSFERFCVDRPAVRLSR